MQREKNKTPRNWKQSSQWLIQPMQVKVNKAAEGTRLLKMLLLLISWKHVKAKVAVFNWSLHRLEYKGALSPTKKPQRYWQYKPKISISAWKAGFSAIFYYYCLPLTWPPWDGSAGCIRWNSTAGSFPAKTSPDTAGASLATASGATWRCLSAGSSSRTEILSSKANYYAASFLKPDIC